MALSTLTAPPSPGGCASSVPNSAASLPIACAATRPQSLPGAEALNAAPASLCSLTPDHHLREDFTVLAKDLVTSLKSIVATLVCERGRLRAAMESPEGVRGSGGSGLVAALRTNLSTALHQNSVYRTELRSRLSRIHDASDLAEISSMGANSDNPQFKHSLSYSSSCVSASEFFDAEEHDEEDLKPTTIIANESGVIELDGDSTSEAGSLSSEDGSASSDNSEAPIGRVGERPSSQLCPLNPPTEWSRRSRLPSPRPNPGGPSLWNLLYKNIGKDLSQISMPVTINEPLNMLQRLCEELEYSELLDTAAGCVDSVERMSLVAAFAVSAYAASAHRAASKPFNPLLAETYECIREDKGFRFLAEQVSHHPPVSACYAESSKWTFWQEARIKTKFWGKSMEFQPAGNVHLKLSTTGDHYTWNKVTTCVHNLFGGQRWVDQYGEMHIVCRGSDITCKLNFVKASSWSNSRHEVRGAVYCGGRPRLRLHGRWSEGLHAGEPPAARSLWRPGAMPPEYELYYGFTRFAMELNEIEPGTRELLPYTDTRLRPDQRALEEGDVEGAEQYKLQLEQAQRERRRLATDHTPAWFRKTMEDGEEAWVFAGTYWRERECGFPNNNAPRLW
ncbi:oxysterol-binding protein-related protein 6-like [Leptidea sinapis]|uniref:oxysterol-binding protein-related protein 6-like n=1 Tax=Leptidea sinapis TaxID=189913 RepID=UPI0021C42EE6|nr:oxysterol-binding protein-related protein 6-like [Leptidea sinapis]